MIEYLNDWISRRFSQADSNLNILPPYSALSDAQDVLISLSVLSVSCALIFFIYKRMDIRNPLVVVFSILIFSSGLMQLLVLATYWTSNAELDALIKTVSALFIAASAIAVWPIAVRAVNAPGKNMKRLQNTVSRLEYEIAERKRAEEQLQKSQEQLRQLAAYQEQIKEDERKRIAREIHDDLGQNLMALRIDVSILQARTGDSHPLLNEKVGNALQHIDTTIKAVRSIINNLRPSVLDLGLYAAIEWQVAEFERRTGIDCEVHAHEAKDDIQLDDQRATALFRILQESLTNVARHSQASLVHIELFRKNNSFFMKIADNGIGIFPGCRRKPNSFGLMGIGERISMLGGEFTVDSVPGKGTVLTIEIPLETMVTA